MHLVNIYGEKGNAVEAYLKDADKIKADCIIACGRSKVIPLVLIPPITEISYISLYSLPKPNMLKVLKQKLSERDNTLPCLVSLEERMTVKVETVTERKQNFKRLPRFGFCQILRTPAFNLIAI